MLRINFIRCARIAQIPRTKMSSKNCLVLRQYWNNITKSISRQNQENQCTQKVPSESGILQQSSWTHMNFSKCPFSTKKLWKHLYGVSSWLPRIGASSCDNREVATLCSNFLEEDLCASYLFRGLTTNLNFSLITLFWFLRLEFCIHLADSSIRTDRTVPFLTGLSSKQTQLFFTLPIRVRVAEPYAELSPPRQLPDSNVGRNIGYRRPYFSNQSIVMKSRYGHRHSKRLPSYSSAAVSALPEL